MTYYIFVDENNKINGCGQCRILNEEIQNIEVAADVYASYAETPDRFIYSDGEIIENPNYAEEQAQKERERLDSLTLTPSDVERALYKAKSMDFEDLKTLIAEKIPTLDLKGLAIEFRAKDFWRGATLQDGTRIFDVVGTLLGYTPGDMDYLFVNKELPVVNNSGPVENEDSEPELIADDENVNKEIEE